MSDFLVLRKPDIMTRPGENSNNAIKPNWAFLLLAHTNTWSKRSAKSLIVPLKVFDVKKELPTAPVTTLMLLLTLCIGKSELSVVVISLICFSDWPVVSHSKTFLPDCALCVLTARQHLMQLAVLQNS